MSEFRIDTLHRKNGQEVYAVSVCMNKAKTITRPLFPGKVFTNHNEAFNAAMEALDLWNPRF